MVTERSEPWLLKRGDEVLAEVHLTPDGDFPWYAGRFVPRPAFEDVRDLFEAQDDPTDEERQIALGVFATPETSRRQAAEDLLWALLNTPEFVFKN